MKNSPPTWLNRARCPDWIYQALETSIGDVNDRMCGGKIRRRTPKSLAAVGGPCCFCCGMPVAVLTERDGKRGVVARFEHWQQVRHLFQAFASCLPAPAEYANVLLRVIVPAANAQSLSHRRCLTCSVRFDLRSPEEVAETRHCARCT